MNTIMRTKEMTFFVVLSDNFLLTFDSSGMSVELSSDAFFFRLLAFSYASLACLACF